MKIEYSGDNPQFLGMSNGKPFIVSKEKPLDIPEKELIVLRKRKWFNHLMSKGLIKIDGKTEETEQDEKPKKKKKEKVIQVDLD